MKANGIADLHINGPHADFISGTDYYHRCEERAEEAELLLKGPLSTKPKAVHAIYVMLWAGKTGCTHIKSL